MQTPQTYINDTRNDLFYFQNGKITKSLGRNGEIKTKGVDVFLWEPNENETVVEISPITTRESIGRCHVQIPASDIPALIETLQKFI